MNDIAVSRLRVPEGSDKSLMTSSVLIADSVPAQAQTYAKSLRAIGLTVRTIDSGESPLVALKESGASLLVLDLELPNSDPLRILEAISAQPDPAATLATSSNPSLNAAIRALRLGAYDYLVKPFHAQRLVTAAREALSGRGRLRPVSPIDADGPAGLIGSSPVMRAVHAVSSKAARSKATVFITGETGTGKEVVARLIHEKSQRAEKPFIAINCSAIPRDLMESEIFGHVKGAFTGAVADRAGAVLQANGGTLFLDEICEMHIDLQAKLLRFLQEGTVRRVGASKTERVDVRIICATNRDPAKEVQAGRFREDLYYRLHVIAIPLPPLRDRDDDAVEIARVLVRQFAAEEGKDFGQLSPSAEAAIAAYHWPGNIRQLQNVLRTAVVLNVGTVLSAEALPELIGPSARSLVTGGIGAETGCLADPDGSIPSAGTLPAAAITGVPAGLLPPGGRSLEAIERHVIENTIAACNNSIAQAAAALRVSPSTIYRKRKQWLATGT